jgi:formylmethanofuran dehydrogenase subunit E
MKQGIVFLGLLILAVALGSDDILHNTHEHDGLHVVFKQIPRDAHDYRADIVPLIEPIIARHGVQEWEIVVLTHEFHRHLGVYSILGAKMGLYAREHFQVGLDELEILSFAGQHPPISCLSDGLQVSTGATLGHGTIRIAENTSALPKAQFKHGDQTITLTLKPVYWEQIKQDIQQAIQQHGAKTPEYWQAVRKLGLHYWLQWSRSELFELAVLTR